MLKVFLVEDETVIREGLRDRIPWEQYGYRFVGDILKHNEINHFVFTFSFLSLFYVKRK